MTVSFPCQPMYAAFFAFQGMAFPKRPCMWLFCVQAPLEGVFDPAATTLTTEHMFFYHMPSLWNV